MPTRSLAQFAALARAVVPMAACLIVLAPAPHAMADDAYVCDGGRLVYARPETLEKLKETDPCIAGYYGAKPGAAAMAAPPALATPAGRAEAAPNRSAPAVAPALRGAQPGVPTGDRPTDARKRSPVGPQLKQQQTRALEPAAKPKAPEAAHGTDFRNVRVINATDAATTFYRHDR